jgi:osmotically-inducible protein OsmY
MLAPVAENTGASFVPVMFEFPKSITGGTFIMSLLGRAYRLGLTMAGIAFFMIWTAAMSRAAGQDSAPAADNTKANQEESKTADQQKENKTDRELARQIRKSIVADKTLSTYAHNVKIIASNGVVTLRGPVRSEDEKSAIEAKAKAVAGVNDVKNELTIAPEKMK